MKFLLGHVEVAGLIFNLTVLLAFCVKRPFEPGKFFYWLGASILMIGILKMRG
jgi:hypothetical protein